MPAVPYTGIGAINNEDGTDIQEIIETFFIRLVEHPWIQNPTIYDRNGNQVRITHFRDFDGLDVHNFSGTGLTLSIFPYNYANSTDGVLTTNSNNASIVWSPYALGNQGTPLGPNDKCKSYIAFKLHLFGYDQLYQQDNFAVQSQQTVFVFNQSEQILRKWVELLRMILVTRLQRLPAVFGQPRNLLINSFPNWALFHSGRWDKDESIVFHTATILLEAVHYPKRFIDETKPVRIIGGPVGTIPDPNNPGQFINVCYDLTQDRYYNCDTDAAIPVEWLIDPDTNQFYATLETNVVQVLDMISQSRRDFITLSNQP